MMDEGTLESDAYDTEVIAFQNGTCSSWKRRFCRSDRMDIMDRDRDTDIDRDI